jgi:cell division protein ZapA
VKDLSIKVTIANRIYPLTVKSEEEEAIRQAVKEIEEMIREYEQSYAVKDKQDLLAMCALQYATQVVESKMKDEVEGNGLMNRLRKLNESLAESV